MSDLRNVTVTAFVGAGTRMELHAPHEYGKSSGGTAVTSWILSIGDRQDIHFHFDDPADLDRLVEVLSQRGAL